ncbi:MAG: glycosyltransferase [Planctomycetia bacterium]|nr:glycosyltransferase [Planctomycetia bacterium]
MLLMLALQYLAAAMLLLAAAVGLYCLGLAVVGLCARSHATPATQRRQRFAILIPAHNEEDQIETALRCCADLDYPRNRVQVFVIADNCTDRTAALARAGGATCLERHDLSQRGKGPALAWALKQVLPTRPEAVLILDADCRLDRHALRVFNARLAAGEQVLQASYVASNPDGSIASYVAAVANAIENDLFYAPKAVLGLSVLLRGTGMAFRREVLERFPWQAASVVEDVEYTVRLYQGGVRVAFVPEVRVWSAFPEQDRQMQVQRTRWVGGNIRLGVQQAWPLLRQAVAAGRPLLVELAWTLLVSVRSLAVAQMLLAVLLGAVAAVLMPGLGFGALAGLLLVLYAVYFGLGVTRLGLNVQRMALLLRAPWMVFRMLWIGSASLFPGRTASWERTPR